MSVRKIIGMTAVALAVAAVGHASSPQKYPWIHVSAFPNQEAQTQLMWLTCDAIAGHLAGHFERDAIQANYETALACGFIN